LAQSARAEGYKEKGAREDSPGLISHPVYAATLAEVFGRRPRSAKEGTRREERKGPGGRVEQRLPN